MTYLVGNSKIRSDDSGFDQALAAVHGSKSRPRCLCIGAGVEMYIARIQGKYVIKRMPDSGGSHHPSCDSYEPPAELSGLGQVMGTAIQESPDTGITALKFDFSLSKTGGRAAPVPGDGETDSVKTDGSKLTLRGVLHYLWEQAGFNRWSPSMAGKRSWFVIRKHLLQAAAEKSAKGVNLVDILYMPEAFNAERHANATARRIAYFGKVASPTKGARRLMMVIGEVKELSPSRYGQKIVLKHLPDCHFMLNDDMHKRLVKRFAVELGLWDGIEGTKLLVIATFSVGQTGIASVEEAALMTVTDSWLPFDSVYEKMVLDGLAANGRRFMKGLRYNLPSSKPLACTVAIDTQPAPTALYVVPPGSSDEYSAEVSTLAQDSKLASWIWSASSGEMPALPSNQVSA
jgi:hypothetical protein